MVLCSCIYELVSSDSTVGVVVSFEFYPITINIKSFRLLTV